jgi:hypothetical protein
MKEWEKIHTQFIQVFGQASSGDSSDDSKEVSPSNSLGAEDDYYKCSWKIVTEDMKEKPPQ